MTDEPTPAPAELAVDHAAKTYTSPAGTLEVLRDVSFSVSPGHSVAIVGPSGSGKSTLLNIIGSLDTPSAGAVSLGDIDVGRLAGAELAHFRSRHVGFVFQNHHLLPQCTAFENVMLPTLAAPRENAGAQAQEVLERVGLAGRMHAFPAQLSGGEQQRVAIARALINHPPLLLCDEPTGNLDHETGAKVGALFCELASEREVMLIVVTHDLEFARRFSRRVELRDGVLHNRGPERDE